MHGVENNAVLSVCDIKIWVINVNERQEIGTYSGHIRRVEIFREFPSLKV